MPSPSRLLLSLLAATATAGALSACGDDEPLGKTSKTSPAPVTDETTTAQLTTAAVKTALPSVVAVSVSRGGSTLTGTGTVLARGLVVTDAMLVGGASVAATPTPSPKPTSKPTPKPTSTPAAGGTTPQGTTPATTTPSGTSPTTPAKATPRPTPRVAPLPRIATPPTVTVREASGEEHDATVEGVDPVSGLAVLRVGELDSVPTARAGAAPKLGEQLAAIAYLSARRPAVRPGTVVATGRSSRRNRESEVGLIEATAPLGQQGIGGPLVDGRGQVVAITTRAITSIVPGTVVGLPYANSIRISRALLADGKVRRAYLGLDTVGITPSRADELHLSTASGVLIQTIVPGSPAAFSSLKGATGHTWIGGRLIPTGSDAITSIDGKPVREPEDLDAALATMQPGHKATLRVIRDTHGLDVHVTLSER